MIQVWDAMRQVSHQIPWKYITEPDSAANGQNGTGLVEFGHLHANGLKPGIHLHSHGVYHTHNARQLRRRRFPVEVEITRHSVSLPLHSKRLLVLTPPRPCEHLNEQCNRRHNFVNMTRDKQRVLQLMDETC
jgi:hypothetical protein